MIVWQTIAVAFAMFSAVPVPQPVWNEKKYAVRAVRLSAGRSGMRSGMVGLGCGVGTLFLPDLLRSGAVPGFRCLSPAAFIWMDTPIPVMRWTSCASPEKKAGDSEGPALRCVCAHPAVHLFYCISGAVCGRALYPRDACAWAQVCAGAGALRAGGGLVPPGEIYGPCPQLPLLPTGWRCGTF